VGVNGGFTKRRIEFTERSGRKLNKKYEILGSLQKCARLDTKIFVSKR